MNRLRASLLPLCAFVLTACGDTNVPDDCGPVESCVPASSLRVDSVRIVTAGEPHPVTGGAIARGDSLTVRYSVTNTGRGVSEPRTVQLSGSMVEGATSQIPALEANQTFRESIRLGLSAPWVSADRGDRVAVTVELDPTLDDSRTGENALLSDSVHVELPMLAMEIAPASVPRVRANEPFQMRITLRNASATTAARDIQLRHCLWDYDVSCWPRYWAAFGTLELADLAPGESREVTYSLAIPPEATWFDSSYTYVLSVCVTPADHDAPYTTPEVQLFQWHCGYGFYIEVWPDFEACPPAMLGSGPVTLDAANCGFYPPTDPPQRVPHRLFVWALDAVAGITYRVEGLPGPVNDRGDPVTDLDPAGDRLRFERSGRYYFVLHAQEGPRTGRADPMTTDGIR